MLNKNKKIIFVIIITIIIQYFLSYYLYEKLEFNSPYTKVFTIYLANWFIVFIVYFTYIHSYNVTVSNFEDLQSKHNLTLILYDLLKNLADVEELSSIYQQILDAAVLAVPGANMGSLMMRRDDKMIFEAARGFEFEYLELMEIDVEDTALYRYTSGKMDRAVYIQDINNRNKKVFDMNQVDLFEKAGAPVIRASISAPIIVNGEVMGSVNLDSDKVGAFDEEDLEILQIFAMEVSKFVRLYDTLEHNVIMSRYDEMTGIYNRSYCSNQLKELIESQVPFVLVMMDLNNLKIVNDTYGHDMGDEYINSFVKGLRLFIPESALFARYGGDEFLVIFPNTQEVIAKVVMDDAARFFHNNLENAVLSTGVTFSYGLIEFPDEAETYDEILKIVDERMYKCKREMKGKI